MSDYVIPEIKATEAEMISIRHYLHANPELSLEEFNTSELVASKLTEWGYQVTRGLGKTGVVGSLSKGDSPRTIGLRADMDALPIEETTGLPWASTAPGKMHACGHDGHTTILLAAAKYIASPACQFNGTVHLIFQPAEEAIGGADLMIKDGLFEQFPCERI
ncbi:TPA: amidohydrolase, partial [Klebsiella pneumoniae]|nr:amidohydrolase [Klebsiella pneumoniae]